MALLHVYFSSFCWWKLMIWPPMAMVSVATKGHEPIISDCCHASQCDIGWSLQLLSIEHPDWSKGSHAPALWRHAQSVNNQTGWCCWYFTAVKAKNIGHFRRVGLYVGQEISQIYIEHIKPTIQMSNEPLKFFTYCKGDLPWSQKKTSICTVNVIKSMSI